MAEHRRAAARRQIHAIEEDHVEVDVQVQRGAKALHQCHRAGVARGAGKAGFVQKMPAYRAVHGAENQRQRIRVRSQQEPQGIRQRQHPLPQRTLRQHLIGQ
jgi:hypothetical protein